MAVGVMATTAPWAPASVLERITADRPLPSSQSWMSPQVRAAASERRNPPSDSTATRARSKRARSAAWAGVSIPVGDALAGLHRSEFPYDGQHAAVRAPAWRWGFPKRRAEAAVAVGPFREARTHWRSLQGESCPAHSWALATADPASRNVATAAPEPARAARSAGHGEGLGWQRRESDFGAPFVEKPPLDAVGAASVVGERPLPGRRPRPGRRPELGEGRGLKGDDLGADGGGHEGVSGGVDFGA